MVAYRDLAGESARLYREFVSRGVQAKEPLLRNGIWVTVVVDADGYTLDSASPTDAPEETTLSEWEAGKASVKS
jgi:hypothetical protein